MFYICLYHIILDLYKSVVIFLLCYKLLAKCAKIKKKELFFRCAQSIASLVSIPKNKKKKSTDENEISIFVVELLLVANVTLLLIDQIHFQYNGFLFGILLISISHILKVRILIFIHNLSIFSNKFNLI